jgi:predicted PurR-regulated permease PerM
MIKLPRYSRMAFVAVAASLIAPAYCFARELFDPFYVPGRIASAFWPALNMFRPAEGYEDPNDANNFIILCVAGNVLLYLVVFSAAWCVARLIRARSRSFHDGTI